MFKIEKNEFFKELGKELEAKSMRLRLRTYLAVPSLCNLETLSGVVSMFEKETDAF